MVAIPIQQVANTVTYVQPVTISATAPTHLIVTTSAQHQQFPKFVPYVHPYTQCTNNYLLHIHPEWSDPEEEKKELNEQEEGEEKQEEEEDWDGTIQKQKEKKKNENSNKVMRKFPNQTQKSYALQKPKMQKCIPHSSPILW